MVKRKYSPCIARTEKSHGLVRVIGVRAVSSVVRDIQYDLRIRRVGRGYLDSSHGVKGYQRRREIGPVFWRNRG